MTIMSNLVVNTNMLAINAHNSAKRVGVDQSMASQRLASGKRINTAADDAAGLAISEKMTAQVRGLNQASRNTQDGISLLQTADGGLSEIGNMAQRIRELTVQAANGTNQSSDVDKIQSEVTNLTTEITNMASRVQFNGKNLLQGDLSSSVGSGVTFQIGANSGQIVNMTIEDMRTPSLYLGTTLTSLSAMSTYSSSQLSALLDDQQSAIEVISTQRAKIGAMQNRLNYTGNSLDISSQNLQAARSRIEDTDMAAEMMNLTKTNVLQQAATSMLTQANQGPQQILQLLR
jgi:flagellin